MFKSSCITISPIVIAGLNILIMQVRMEESIGRMEEGWNNGLSGGDIAAVVLYFILVLGIGLYVCHITSFLIFLYFFPNLFSRIGVVVIK